MAKYGKIGFNAEAAKSQSKEDWIKDNNHLKDDVDLSAKYDELVGEKKDDKPAKKKAE
jgi:hypothetical protein